MTPTRHGDAIPGEPLDTGDTCGDTYCRTCVRKRAARVRRLFPEFDRDAYNRGWRSAWSEGALDRADARRESDEWYQGYHDSAHGTRGKWHLPLCEGLFGPEHHDNREGGCGRA